MTFGNRKNHTELPKQQCGDCFCTIANGFEHICAMSLFTGIWRALPCFVNGRHSGQLAYHFPRKYENFQLDVFSFRECLNWDDGGSFKSYWSVHGT